MIRIADFDSAEMPFLFVGTTTGGSFLFQLACPKSWLAGMANMPLEEIVELEGAYQRLFAGALITSAVSRGDVPLPPPPRFPDWRFQSYNHFYENSRSRLRADIGASTGWDKETIMLGQPAPSERTVNNIDDGRFVRQS